jgi:hypothetical protein
MGSFFQSLPAPSSELPSEDFLSKMVRLGKNPASLLMRVDMRGLHYTTYVVGRRMLKIRVKTLAQINWP